MAAGKTQGNELPYVNSARPASGHDADTYFGANIIFYVVLSNSAFEESVTI